MLTEVSFLFFCHYITIILHFCNIFNDFNIFSVCFSREIKGWRYFDIKKVRVIAVKHTSYILEATPGFEPGIRVLQTRALPLGYIAVYLNIIYAYNFILELIKYLL